MSATVPHAVLSLFKSKYLLSAAAALMLAACSDSMDRFASNPSDADPVYTASVPKQKIIKQTADEDNGGEIVSRPLANASMKQPVYNYQTSSRTPAYRQPALTRPSAPQVVEAAESGSQVTVGNGMTLYSIARANNLTVAELAAVNNIRAPYAVHNGQVLRIPGNGQAMLPQAPAKAAKPQKTASGLHQVESGDTLFSLGRKYGVSPYTIADANGLSHNTQLHLGQKVTIPGASGTHVAQKTAGKLPPKQQLASADSAETVAPAPAEPEAAAEVVAKVEPAAPAVQPEKLADAQPADNSASGMRWPVRGKVISNFGAKPNGLKNEGINISVPEGTSIRAAEGGVVAYAGNELKGYGNLILVRHEGGYVTAYAHAKELFVKRGDTVKRGDVIAKAGQTGSVSSPQLHFEVRKGATALDPMKFLASSTASN